MIIIFGCDKALDSFKNPVLVICFAVFVISTVLFVKVVNTEQSEIKEVYVSDIMDSTRNVIRFDKPMKIAKTTFHKDWRVMVDNPKYYVENIK